MKITDSSEKKDFFSLLCEIHGWVDGYHIFNNIVTYTFRDGYVFKMDVPNYGAV